MVASTSKVRQGTELSSGFTYLPRKSSTTPKTQPRANQPEFRRRAQVPPERPTPAHAGHRLCMAVLMLFGAVAFGEAQHTSYHAFSQIDFLR